MFKEDVFLGLAMLDDDNECLYHSRCDITIFVILAFGKVYSSNTDI